MRGLVTIVLAALMATNVAWAQTDTEEGTIYLSGNKESSVTSKDGRMQLTLNGLNFDFGAKKSSERTVVHTRKSSGKSVYFGIVGIGSPNINHLAAVELGVNTLVNTDYSAYTPEEANAMLFSSRKAVSFTCNIATLNAPLNKRRTLVASMAFGITSENYTFAGPYTMELRDGMMHPVKIDDNPKKSKLTATYIHMPIMLDWNIKSNFFIAAGINFDVLVGSHLKYKFPKTKIKDELMLSPVQVGLTARIGWKRIYGFVNYAFVDMFKQGGGPKGKRLSAGVGFWF